MQITKLAASLAAMMVTASLLAGARIGFDGTTVMSASGPRVRTPPPATTRMADALQARATNRASASSVITMPYYSYGASLPTFLKD